jgi:hypothetical protein
VLSAPARCSSLRPLLSLQRRLGKAQPPQPQPDPMPPAIATPVDKPYVGPVKLAVDVTDHVRHVAHVHEDIPVEKGARKLVLLYPQWILGNHSPTGPISKLGGIVTTFSVATR